MPPNKPYVRPKVQDSNGSFNTQWAGLNPHLIAKIFPVNSKGERIAGNEVHAPLLDGAEIEASMNWASAFENSGVESIKPTMSAMVQSGAIAPVLNSLEGDASSDRGVMSRAYGAITEATGINSGLKSAAGWAGQFEGRTGMTKLNSMQIFTGSMPIRLTITAVFRAFMDPIEEVMRPKDQLWEWSLPQHLQEDGIIAGFSKNDSLVGSFLPSEVPQLIGLKYKGRILAPLVIESISEPLDAPIDGNASCVQVSIPLSIASLTALDKNDWIKSSSTQ